ncbi:autotransporter assembly complex protein TamA [Ostreibacterium oceani]|nr:autotransporter assembly complex family protein [Ostreibacterium oceani]
MSVVPTRLACRAWACQMWACQMWTCRADLFRRLIMVVGFCLLPLKLPAGLPAELPESASVDASVDTAATPDQSAIVAQVSPTEVSPAEVLPAEGATLQVAVTGVDDPALIENINAFLEILAESDQAIDNPPYIQYLIERGKAQISTALQPFGYYQSTVNVVSAAAGTGDSWHVDYQVVIGEPTTVSAIEVKVVGAGAADADFVEQRQAFPFQRGDVLQQIEYTAFKNALADIAIEKGYFDADFTTAEIRLAADLQTATVALTYDTGPRFTFDDPTISQDFLNDNLFSRYNTIESGQAYSSGAIADLQRDLYNSGYVQLIDVTAKPDRDSKTVPVDLALTPKKNKRHRFALGFETDLGPRFQYEFDWRWVNRRGHQLTSDFFISPEWQQTGVEYRIPANKPATDYYKLFADVTLDKTDNRDVTIWQVGGAYRDQVGHLAREFGVKWSQENFEIGNDAANVALLTPYFHLIYHKTDDPLNTRDGLAVEGYVTGTDASISDISFLQAVAKAKYIKRFDEKHKITTKGAIGQTWTDDFHVLPPSYRFFTGGDKTIRGYGFQSIGDVDGSGDVIGGDRLVFASAEYSYFFKDNMAIAAFVDAGDAFTSDFSIKVGAGLGFHYYSPIGPIKVDIAHGFDETGDAVRLHLNIGPDL